MLILRPMQLCSLVIDMKELVVEIFRYPHSWIGMIESLHLPHQFHRPTPLFHDSEDVLSKRVNQSHELYSNFIRFFGLEPREEGSTRREFTRPKEKG